MEAAQQSSSQVTAPCLVCEDPVRTLYGVTIYKPGTTDIKGHVHKGDCEHQYDRRNLPHTSPPAARTSDPETSHAAARSVTGVNSKQADVLRVLRELGPATDATLLLAYRDFERQSKVQRQSDSGVRTRRSELTHMDPPKIVRVATVKLPSGRRAIQWKVAE